LRRIQYAIERLAAFQRLRIHFAEDGLKDFCNIGGFNVSGNQFLGGAKNEILNEKQINLVPVGRKFYRLTKMALQKKAESVLTRHGRGDQEMTKVDSLYFPVHLIQPEKIAVPNFLIGPRTGFCTQRIWSAGQFELACQGFVDRIQPGEILPRLGNEGRNCIRLPSAGLICGSRFHD